MKMGNEDLIEALKGTSGGLSTKLANAIIDQAAQTIEEDMTCKEHRGSPIVVFD